MIKYIILICILFKSLFAAEIGQTEITTEGGIEVFQLEKYYYLKKNIDITTNDFKLKAEESVKAFFDKDLYDIINVEAKKNVFFESKQGLKASGENINFSIKDENIEILGKKSSLLIEDINMFSNQLIKVNHLTGKFILIGKNSSIITSDSKIYGSKIDGIYKMIDKNYEVQEMIISDNQEVNIQNATLNMFALKAHYSKKNDTIELFENVKIIRGKEIILGDHAIIDIVNQSYKVKNKDSNKVKVLISESNE